MYFGNVHRFRGLAILGIVGAHSLHNFTWQGSEAVYALLNAITNQSSIWFFFIAGFLFQHLSPRFEVWNYYTKKINYVILPYFFCSIPALLFISLFSPTEIPSALSEYGRPGQIAIMLLTGSHLAPFWFVPTISILYLLSPVLLKGSKNGWLFRLLPLLMLSSLFLGRDGLQHLTGWGLFISPISKALYLASAYIFGMFFCRYYEKCRHFCLRHWPLLTVVCIGILALTALTNDKWFHPIFAFKILSGALLLLLLDRTPAFLDRPFSVLGDKSFGIFFVHGYILALSKFVIAGDMHTALPVEGNVFYWLLLIVVASLLSLFTLAIASRIFGGRSRQFVGA